MRNLNVKTVPLSEIRKPEDGKFCVCDRFWLVKGDCALVSIAFSNFLYHRDERVLRALYESFIQTGEYSITHLDVAYVSHKFAA